jgi:hypothetical protein
MSIQAPQGILNIPNATLRVGKLAVDSTAGFDTVFNNVERNTILLVDSTEYDDTKQWDLKMPNIFVATFEIKGTGSSFNFRNTSNGDATVGYTLEFSGTTLTLKYDDDDLTTATIPNLDATYGKVYLTYEKQYFTVTVDGTRVLVYKDDVTRTPPDGEYINFFAGTGTPRFQNLKVVAGHLISDGTSNVSLYGGLAVTSNLEVGQANLFVDTTTSRVGVGTTEPDASLHVSGNAYVSSNLEVGSSNLFVDTVNSRVGVGTDTPKESLDIVGNMHLTRVSNVSQIKVDSNVVTEYTGPHDRPLRKYPEVALTANDNSSTSGYVADQSSTNGFADGLAYRLFDHSTTAYQSGGAFSGGIATGSNPITTASDESTHQGVAITLDLATKIRLSYAKITSHTFYGRTPAYGSFLGSNDNTTWELIGTFAGLSTTAVGQTHTVHIADYASKSAYRYIRLVVTRTSDSLNLLHGGTLLEFRELEYYGYEEGSGSLDTTLKSVYNVPATTGTQLEVYYDAKDLENGAVTNVTDLSPNTNGGTGTDVTVADGAFVFNGTSSLMEKTTLSIPGSDNPFTISFWLKNDDFDNNQYILRLGINQTIYETVAIYKNSSNQIVFASWTLDFPIDYTFTSGQWNHISLIYPGGGWKQSNLIACVDGKPYTFGGNVSSGGVGGTVLSLATSLTLRLGGFSAGNTHLDGSVANFRLYSKALNADQVKELYDYQKDYFLGSKSQVTLYKGHLGVGVTEPSGQLELAGDERIQEYPPGPMSNYETLIPGHGVFCAYASTEFSASFPSSEAFNDSEGWISKSRYNGTVGQNGVYTGSVSTNGVLGEWLEMKSPYGIKLSGFNLASYPDANSNRQPRNFVLFGSTDGNIWNQMKSVNNLTSGYTLDGIYHTVNSTEYYTYFRVVVSAVQDNTDGLATITRLRYFGTPGPTTLDKGSLSLGRSLDVPRISRYDVDTETPRPEKLLIDYDTTVNSSPTDISGKGNHGAFGGSAYYSSADKAFILANNPAAVSSASTHYIEAELNNTETGNQYHSVSLWFKVLSGQNSSWRSIFESSENPRSGNGSISLYVKGATDVLVFAHGTTNLESDPISNLYFQWHHIVLTYDGANRKMYLDGVLIKTVATTTWSGVANMTLRLGKNNATSGNEGCDCHISNFKLYWQTALEPSEVQKLYRLGRTGRSMVISDTAVGIGKVPEAQLDVRGTARFDTISDFLKIDHPGNQLSLSRSDTDANEFRWYTWGNGCNWFTPYTGMSIYIGRDGQTIDEFDFYSVTTVKRGGTTLHSSDDRLKRDETFITNATNSILKLKPQTYIKKHRLPENENDTDIPEQFEAGLIAQDVWYDAPELRFLVHPSKDANPSETKPISPDPNDPTQDPDYSSWGTRQAYVNYEGFLPYLIKSNQEIYTELQAEKAKNEALETQVSDLLVRVTALENA